MKATLRTAVGVLAAAAAVSGCGDFVAALTTHARPAARAAGHELEVEALAEIMAESPMPDSALTAHWASQLALLWTDWVRLAALYQEPDSIRALALDALLEEQRHLGMLAVQRYRDSVVFEGIEPTEEEAREWFARRQPFTRLDVRRIRLSVPEDAAESVRDSLFGEARAIRERVAGGADFVEVARARSDEPGAARGQVLTFQGHDDFPEAADSVVFALDPGEVSPVVSAGDAMWIYQVIRRRAPEWEMARDRSIEQQLEERRQARSRRALDSLVENARRAVREGAVELARRMARDSALALGSVAPGTRLVTWEDGEVTVDELRRLFQVRGDIQGMFAAEDDEAIRFFLLELARDEILIDAALREGTVPAESERAAMREALVSQLSQIGRRMRMSHALASNPLFDLQGQSLAFLRSVLGRASPIPWLAEYRFLLDPVFRARVDELGAARAAERARELRAADARSGAEEAAGAEGTGTEGEGAGQQPAPTPGRDTTEATGEERGTPDAGDRETGEPSGRPTPEATPLRERTEIG